MRPSPPRPALQHALRSVGCVFVAFVALATAVQAEPPRAPVSPSEARPLVPEQEDRALVEAKRAVRQRNFARAVELWSEAAQRGNGRAGYHLGVAYQSGRGVPQDEAKAASWFQRAADAGDASARFALGKLYMSGRGVARDRDRALELIGSAARGGSIEAKRMLEQMKTSGSIAYSTAPERVAAHDRDPRIALEQAIRMGDLGSAAEAIARGAPIDGAPGDTRHWRPLVLAVEKGRLEMVELLLSRRADPNLESRLGEPVLIVAIRGRQPGIVRRLLAAGSDPNVSAISGYTPLMEAARLGPVEGQLEIVTALLQSGADPRPTLGDGTSAADIARRFGHARLASRLRQAGAPDRNAIAADSRSRNPGTDSGLTLPPLLEAARRGDVALLREILASRADPAQIDGEGDTALHRAAEGGHPEAVRVLLAAGLSPDVAGRGGTTALMRSVASSNPRSSEIVAVLIEAGADPKRTDSEANGLLQFAWQGATSKKLETLRSAGFTWNETELEQSLEKAASAGKLESLRALTSLVEDASTTDSAICSSIRLAKRAELELLLRGPSSTRGICEGGQTMLLVGAASGKREVVGLLLEAGADPNQVSENGDTPLIAVASRGYPEIVSLLLTAGAEVSHRGAARLTPMMGAAANGHDEVVELLLGAGADRRMRDHSGNTASDLAKAAGHARIAEKIDSHRSNWSGWFGSKDPS